MILITGATGFIGRHLVRRLMAEGRRVRVLLPPERQASLPWDADDPDAPEIVTGTVLDDEALFAAVSGAYVIIHLENALWWGRPRDLERIELVGTRNLIAAARSARVGRIITLSQPGASPSSAFTLLRIKGQFEALIYDSGLAYTVIRSGIVFGADDSFINHIAMVLSLNPFIYLMPGQGEVVLHPLYIDDLVEVLTRALERLNTVDEVIEIGGPEYITLSDLISTVMRVSGIHRYVLPVPPYVLRGLSRLYSLIFRRSLVTRQWLDYLAGNRTAPLGNVYRYFGFQPRRLEDTLLTYMPQRRYFLPALRHATRRRPRGI
ncbi:MAG: SDR family oxidoreductase [Phototrophicaceae bacterium]